MYLSRSTLELYQILLGAAVSLLAIFIVLTYFYFVWKKRLQNMQNGNGNENGNENENGQELEPLN